MAEKTIFYDMTKLLKVGAEWNIIMGQRSNGKSYAVKHYCLEESWKHNETNKFVYLRRWDVDLRTDRIEKYFGDVNKNWIRKVTDNQCDRIIVYRHTFYFAHYDELKEKIVKDAVAGYAMALTQSEHEKSIALPDVSNIIFEEMIPEQAWYLQNEPSKLMQFVSTVLRLRDGHVYMIGNTLTRVCPYFSDWGLVNAIDQKQGTIDVYKFITDSDQEVKIAVEYADTPDVKSKMMFGQAAKQINDGVWETRQMPHLEKHPDEYVKMYELVVEYDNLKFYCQFKLDKNTGSPFWYVQKKTTRTQKGTRLISNKVYNHYMCTIGFVPLNEREAKAFSYIKQKKIFYSDNLTGTDFEKVLTQFN